MAESPGRKESEKPVLARRTQCDKITGEYCGPLHKGLPKEEALARTPVDRAAKSNRTIQHVTT